MVSQLASYTIHITPLLVLWAALLNDWLPGTHDFSSRHYHLILRAPLYVVVMLGIYAVGSITYGVVTFNDCPGAREELVREIKEAEMELKKKKVIE